MLSEFYVRLIQEMNKLLRTAGTLTYLLNNKHVNASIIY